MLEAFQQSTVPDSSKKPRRRRSWVPVAGRARECRQGKATKSDAKRILGMSFNCLRSKCVSVIQDTGHKKTTREERGREKVKIRCRERSTRSSMEACSLACLLVLFCVCVCVCSFEHTLGQSEREPELLNFNIRASSRPSPSSSAHRRLSKIPCRLRAANIEF